MVADRLIEIILMEKIMNNDAREWLEANCPVSMCTQLTEEEVVLQDEKPQLIKLSKCLDFLK